jgi:hypothetical protein
MCIGFWSGHYLRYCSFEIEGNAAHFLADCLSVLVVIYTMHAIHKRRKTAACSSQCLTFRVGERVGERVWVSAHVGFYKSISKFCISLFKCCSWSFSFNPIFDRATIEEMVIDECQIHPVIILLHMISHGFI